MTELNANREIFENKQKKNIKLKHIKIFLTIILHLKIDFVSFFNEIKTFCYSFNVRSILLLYKRFKIFLFSFDIFIMIKYFKAFLFFKEKLG